MVEVGERAPDFELLDTDLKVRRLSDFLGKGKPVVILTFPALAGAGFHSGGLDSYPAYYGVTNNLCRAGSYKPIAETPRSGTTPP